MANLRHLQALGACQLTFYLLLLLIESSQLSASLRGAESSKVLFLSYCSPYLGLQFSPTDGVELYNQNMDQQIGHRTGTTQSAPPHQIRSIISHPNSDRYSVRSKMNRLNQNYVNLMFKAHVVLKIYTQTSLRNNWDFNQLVFIVHYLRQQSDLCQRWNVKYSRKFCKFWMIAKNC